MSLRLYRACLMLGFFLASDVWALGLGDIRLSSALNEPLRAEIALSSVSSDELADLKVQLASASTFERYGIERPLFVTRLEFTVAQSADGAAVVRVRSPEPVTEPFVTFLVEASWPSGRLLREYTVLLDPPTFAPPPTASAASSVTAPGRATQEDSGRIERTVERDSQPAREAPESGFGTGDGGEVYVQRGDTLWQIAARSRPDNRVGMNQMMLAIYEANPQAFGGNLNRLNAGATLTIPSADDIFRISRGDALSEVRRQNAAWDQAAGSAQPSLTLVPPDGDQADAATGSSRAGASDGVADAAAARRIRELEATVAERDSLLEIRDNELAQLRDELERMREAAGRAAVEPAVADRPAEDADATALDVSEALFVDDGEIAAEEPAAAEPAAAEEARPEAEATPQRSVSQVVARPEAPGIVDRITGALSGFWGILGGVLLLVVAILVWLARRAATRGEEESTGVWEALDSDEDMDSESRASTERLRALARDDDTSIVVVEQETQRGGAQREGEVSLDDSSTESAEASIDDTMSSDTAINLDQSDPVAEADFHMAYGLYDQAADLINGALTADPDRQDLLSKLCEIYFVWGNRDSFVDAAGRLHRQIGGEDSSDWDKIVIMGQQIAGDHELFSNVSAGGAASRAVDLSFEGDAAGGELDIDFDGGADGEAGDVIDLGGEAQSAEDAASADYSGLDFVFNDETASLDEEESDATVTREMSKAEAADEATVESPTVEAEAAETTVESPTLERPLQDANGTSELSSLSETAGPDGFGGDRSGDATAEIPAGSGGYGGDRGGEATAEIDLDDLGLDLDALAKTGLDHDIDDADEDAANSAFPDLDATSENRAPGFDLEATGRNLGLDEDDEPDASTGRTNEMPALEDETGKNPAVQENAGDGDDDLAGTDADVDFDTSLLDATGQTQILSGGIGVDTAADAARELEDDDKTALSPAFDDSVDTMLSESGKSGDGVYEKTAALDSDDIDFDFAKTEALPKGSFSNNDADDETSEMPAGDNDPDLDLDDLTSALQFSEGDTVDQPRDDATVEQPIAGGDGSSHQFVDLDFGEETEAGDQTSTQALSSDDFSEDLHDARTMTEVGTKLDLARAYVDMGDPDGARSILEEVLDEGDDGQRQQAQRLIDTLPA